MTWTFLRFMWMFRPEPTPSRPPMITFLPLTVKDFPPGPQPMRRLRCLNGIWWFCIRPVLPRIRSRTKLACNSPKDGSSHRRCRSTSKQDDEIDFPPVSLTMLVDSPVLAGQHFRSIPLAPDVQPPHHLNIAADSEAALGIKDDQIAGYSKLVREAGALFGARHYEHYDFLLSLSDSFYPNGLEHHQSNDDRGPERMLVNPDQTQAYNSLLSHEFTHSWNGKYRRPQGLVTGDFQQPMKDDLLWVYEGLTEYIGEMISARAGLRTDEDYREELASTAAALDYTPGRSWRPLVDTTVSAVFLYDVPNRNWESWRRGVDFYDEGWLIWLEADMVIRRESHGQKSLDDFCRRFYGPPNTPPQVVPYTLDDIITAMNQTLPYDWRGFFHARVDEINEHPPLGGVENGGWRLIYNDTPNPQSQTRKTLIARSRRVFRWAWGQHGTAAKTEELTDVIPGMPAAEAGLAPAMRLVSVNGREFRCKRSPTPIARAESNKRPSPWWRKTAASRIHYEIQYHGGERYPHLERDGPAGPARRHVAPPEDWGQRRQIQKK